MMMRLSCAMAARIACTVHDVGKRVIQERRQGGRKGFTSGFDSNDQGRFLKRNISRNAVGFGFEY